MKNWLQMLTGQKKNPTAAEITTEVEELEKQIREKNQEHEEIQKLVSREQMVLNGGGDASEASVKSLQDKLAKTTTEIFGIQTSINELNVLKRERMAAEKQAQVDAIDQQISDLREWQKQIRPEYIRARVLCDAYEGLLMSPIMGVGLQSRESLAFSRRDREPYEAEAAKITKGCGSIMGQVMDLQAKRKTLLEQ